MAEVNRLDGPETDWWDDPKQWGEVKVIEPGEIEKHLSSYGNGVYKVTRAQLAALERGGVLYLDTGEYGEFIRLDPKE